MNNLKFTFFIVASSLISGCGGSGSGSESNTPPPDHIIFETENRHSGDFLNDPTLIGNTGVDRADDFCNKDSNKPDDGTYKAILVDDANRIAVPAINWVLLPNTTYYKPSGDSYVEVGTTTPERVFNVAFQPLLNSISAGYWVHTGVYDVNDFTSSGFNCENWSSNTSLNSSQGLSSGLDGAAFNGSLSWIGYTFSCADLRRLYCVKQP